MSYDVLVAIATVGSLVAGFVDAVVGGGGLLQVPLLFILFPGFTHTQIIASNRTASVAGTLVAAYGYFKKVNINIKAVIITGLVTAVASFLGVQIMTSISTQLFKTILFFVITALAIYTFAKKKMGLQNYTTNLTHSTIVLLSLVGLALGLYNGAVGPGTGTLLVFSLVHFIRFDFLTASAYSKIINALADMASLITLVWQSALVWSLAVPMLLANMLGAYIGSKFAIRKGNQFIRIFFIIILSILIIRFGYDVFF